MDVRQLVCRQRRDKSRNNKREQMFLFLLTNWSYWDTILIINFIIGYIGGYI